ncbi:MAG TPA: DUF1614 domain-containing protein [Methylomirabilota bacterium]|nr:DUF1614 domain-containing protein [Methylomirabilota bacterium]
MIFLPVAFPLILVLLVLVLVVLVVLIELRILAYAYRKIGVKPRYVFAIMVLTIIGSHVNIPLYAIPATRVSSAREVWMFGQPYVVEGVTRGMTVVAINVGGALIPALLSLYLFVRSGMYVRMAIGILIVSVIVHRLAYVVPGVGIAVPMLVPPLAAAGVALLLAFRRAPPLAYVSGTMGALIGADLTNLGKVAQLGAPVVSIGGAGTFDGVFLTGIIAGLLA